VRFDDVRMRGFRSRADVDDVIAWVDARPVARVAEAVPLAGAAGRVLADDVRSDVDVPAFRRASMDGWAVRGEETFGATDAEPLTLAVVAESRPGSPPPRALSAGEAARIRTGAPVPDGADAVLPAEAGEEAGGALRVRGEVAPGRHVSPVGEDVARGARILARGRRLRPQDVGLLASIGAASVRAVRRPRVAVLTTGSEVLADGELPSAHRIADASGPMLAALVRRDGGIPVRDGPFADDDEGLDGAIAGAPGEIVLVAGGSSVGPEDRAPEIVARRGELAYHGVALRPASPAGVGVVGDRVVFLLPGNPVSSLCAYDFFASRLVRRAGGLPPAWPYLARALPLASKIASELGRVDYVRVWIEDGRVHPLTARGASILSTTTRADGFVVVPKSVEGYGEGAVVPVHEYDRVAT
jgi:molybdopterin molybdotransferase